MISLNNIKKDYSDFSLQINDLNLKNKGFILFNGRSGCGKSTLFKLIMGILKPTSGDILINDSLVSGYNYDIGYVSQSFDLISNLSVYDNIVRYLKIRNIVKEKKDIDNILKKFNLYQKRNKLAMKLSGGEKQKLAIIRVLLSEVKILILDEPTANLDTYTSNLLLQILNGISKECLVLVSSHDELVKEYCDEIYYLENGKIINHEIKNNPKYDYLYKTNDKFEYKNLYSFKENIILGIKKTIYKKSLIINIIITILLIFSCLFLTILSNNIKPKTDFIESYNKNVICVIVNNEIESEKLIKLNNQYGIKDIYVDSLYFNDSKSKFMAYNDLEIDFYAYKSYIKYASEYNLIAGKKDIKDTEIVVTTALLDKINESIPYSYYDSYDKFIGSYIGYDELIVGVIESCELAYYVSSDYLISSLEYDESFAHSIYDLNSNISIKKAYMVYTDDFKTTKKALLKDFNEDYILAYDDVYDHYLDLNMINNKKTIILNLSIIIFISIILIILEFIKKIEKKYYDLSLINIGVKNKTIILNNFIQEFFFVVIIGFISILLGSFMCYILITGNTLVSYKVFDLYFYVLIIYFLIITFIRYLISILNIKNLSD